MRSLLERLTHGIAMPGCSRDDPEDRGRPADGAPGTVATASADPSPDAGDVLLARIVWSRLVEPGDSLAGGLLRALGPVTALEQLAANASAARVRDLVRERTGEEPAGPALRRGLERWRLRLDRAATLADLQAGVERGMRVVTPEASDWPRAIGDLGDHAPPALWVRGDPALLGRAALAVVGARACTSYGSHITAELTEAVCTLGATVVSGAAYGIDATAHRAALALDSPTVAVLAGGADVPYPRAHESLLDRIAASGAVCSEMVPGSTPTRWRFLQRNRSIAALTRATLVTEAGATSGSINTAGHAAELGRGLAAVPGPVTSAASAGCHRLIRDYGATLVTNGAELCEFLEQLDGPAFFAPEPGRPSAGPHDGERQPTGRAPDAGAAGPQDQSGTGGSARPPADHRRALDALPLRGARTALDVARRAGLTLAEAHAALVELELLGTVERREARGRAETGWSLIRRG